MKLYQTACFCKTCRAELTIIQGINSYDQELNWKINTVSFQVPIKKKDGMNLNETRSSIPEEKADDWKVC